MLTGLEDGHDVHVEGSFYHGSLGLRVEGQPLRLKCRRIKGLVVVVLLVAGGGFHLKPAAMGIHRERTKGAKRGGVGEVGTEHKWM